MEFTPFTIAPKESEEILSHEGIPIVSLKLSYPEISENSRAAKRINRFYRGTTKDYIKNVKKYVLPSRIKQYSECLEQSREFYPFEINLSYSVSENSELCLSICRILSEKTKRQTPSVWFFADTWDMRRGWPLFFRDFCREEKPKIFKKKLLDFCIETAGTQLDSGVIQYKPDYEKLIKKHFDKENFLIKEGKFSVFYPPDTIAEAEEGIIEFTFDNCLQK